MTRLFVADPSGAYLPAPDSLVLERAQEVAERRLRRGRALGSPRDAKAVLCALLGSREAEAFCVAFLDKRHRLIEFRELFHGTIDGCSVHPREVVKLALQLNAAAVILVHNHPSGVPEPSQADELITTRLKEALALVDCRVLDHLIVAGNGLVSLAERGLV